MRKSQEGHWVKDYVDNLNVLKSAGPNEIHPIVLKRTSISSIQTISS